MFLYILPICFQTAEQDFVQSFEILSGPNWQDFSAVFLVYPETYSDLFDSELPEILHVGHGSGFEFDFWLHVHFLFLDPHRRPLSALSTTLLQIGTTHAQMVTHYVASTLYQTGSNIII